MRKVTGITSKWQDKPLIWIGWQVNKHCPFQCHYCEKYTWGDKDPANFTWEIYERMADKLIDKYKYGHMEFTGGEPLTFPYLDQLIDKFHNAGWTIGILTNLGKRKEAYKNWIGKVDYICASYHSNVIKTDKQRDAWFKKLDNMGTYLPMLCRVILDPKHWDHVLEVFHTLRTDNLIVLEPVRLLAFDNMFSDKDPALADTHYTLEQNKIIDKLEARVGKVKGAKLPSEIKLTYDDGTTESNEGLEAFNSVSVLSRSRQNNFKGWSCDIGINSLWVGGEGNIAKGACHSYDQRSIGSIDKLNKVQWPTESTICPFELCYCDLDTIISKRKI